MEDDMPETVAAAAPAALGVGAFLLCRLSVILYG